MFELLALAAMQGTFGEVVDNRRSGPAQMIEVAAATSQPGVAQLRGDVAQLAACEPVYEAFPGWTGSTKGVQRYEDLPDGARRYLERLETLTGVPAAIVSTGSERDETIIRRDTEVGRRLGL